MTALSKVNIPPNTSLQILLTIFTALCIGLYYSRAVVSICTVVFAAAAIIGLLDVNNRKQLLQHKPTLALAALFFVYILSFINSTDHAAWLQRLKINVPYLIIPLGIFAFGRLSKDTVTKLLMIFTGVTAITALLTGFDYLTHFAEYNELYKVGKTIPTPIIHVRYSFFLALAAVIGAVLLIEKRIGDRRYRNLCVAFTALNIIMLHALAVRTGIFAFYGALVILAILIIIQKQQWRVAFYLLGGLFIAFLIAFNTMPSIANKLQYVRYDLKMLAEKGALPEYSDNVRITSIRHGINLLTQSPLTGTGIGDIDAEMKKQYEDLTPNFPDDRRHPPISQFIFTFTAFGVLGGIVFFGLFLYPVYHHKFESLLLLGIYATALLSFVAETTIELQLGKTMVIALICVVLAQYFKPDNVFSDGQ